MGKGLFRTSIPIRLNILLIALALLVVFSFGIRTIAGGSFWTQLANGRIMAMQGGVPRTDSLTFSRPEAELVAPTWLYDKTVYAVWQTAGPAGVILLHSLMVTLAFVLLIPLARRWANFPAIAVSLLLSGWLIAFRFNPSPSIITLIFPAAFLALLYSRARPVYLWTVIPLIQWIWTNTSTSFLLGPVLVTLMAIESFFTRNHNECRNQNPQTYLGLAGFCLLLTLINPYGFNLHRHVWALWFDPALPYVSEWISPFASQFKSNLPSLLLTATLLIGAVGLITYRERLPIMLTIIVALTAFLSVRSMRFIEVMALLAFPFTCLASQAMLNALAGMGKSMGGGKPKKLEYATAGLAVLIAGISFWSIIGNGYYSRTGSDRSFGMGIESAALPVEAGAVIARPDFPVRMLNMPIDGGYLSWRLPERKIYIDARIGVFEREMHAKLHRALLGDDEAWEELLDGEQIDAILVPCFTINGGMIFQNISDKKDWQLVFFDGTSAIFVRKDPQFASILNDADLRQTGLDLLDEAHAEYRQKLQSSGGRLPNSARLIGAGNVFYATGRLQGASSIFDMLAQGSPNMTTAWLVSGISRARMRTDYETAIRMLRRACSLNPEMGLGWMWLSRCYEEIDNPNAALTAYERGLEVDSGLGRSFSKPGSVR